MAARFVLRTEPFGALLYDRRCRSARALTSTEAAQFLSPNADTEHIHSPAPEAFGLSAPTAVHLVITRRCQLNCSHCLNESGPAIHDEPKYSVVVRWLRELSSLGVFEVIITGGEPLCYGGLSLVLQVARDLGFTVLLNTNLVCSQRRLDELIHSGVALIRTSLDGLKENNDALRGAGTFDRTVASIRYLVARGQAVRVNVTLARRNIQDITGIVSLADELGCDVKVNPLICIGRAARLSDQCLTREESAAVAEQICVHQRIKTIAVHVQVMSTAMFASCADVRRHFCYRVTDCGIRCTQVTIDSDGKAYGVGRLTDIGPREFLGSAYTSLLPELWRLAQVHAEQMLCPDCRSAGPLRLLCEDFTVDASENS
jgi:MoaA/NifB/PqqE/SkfB family radical SAM enzyme